MIRIVTGSVTVDTPHPNPVVHIGDGDTITVWAEDGKRMVSMQCEVRVRGGRLEVFSDEADFKSFTEWESMRGDE